MDEPVLRQMRVVACGALEGYDGEESCGVVACGALEGYDGEERCGLS